MDKENNDSLIILVVEDVHETRDGIEKLLKVDGYRVAVARDERDGIESAQRQRPDLILVSLAGLPREVIVTARRIREKAAVGEDVPVVVFCIDEIAEGDEVAIGNNVHVARPDNFNQLRGLLTRLLSNSKGRLTEQMHPSSPLQKVEIMTVISKTLVFSFIDASPSVLLELTNTTEKTLKSIEILTVFLKDEETPGGGPSRAHIRFDPVESMKPREKAVLSHRTWINGRPADADQDQLGRLTVIPGDVTPYVLDISWQDAEGRTRYQRIPVGH